MTARPPIAHRPRGFRQSRCPGCGLTPALCLCRQWPPLDSSIDISVVMPSSEARSASNTSRLLALWLPRTRIHVRGDRAGRAVGIAGAETGAGNVLLFPGAAALPDLAPGSVRHLIVPDGTWSQARRIERRCFAALGLPQLELAADWPSIYTLRRGGARLCTFEAAAISLGLSGDVSLAEALLERFSEWTARALRLKAGENSEDAAISRPGAARLSALPPHPTHPAIARLAAHGLPSASPNARLRIQPAHPPHAASNTVNGQSPPEHDPSASTR